MNYREVDPLAHAFRLQLEKWAAASWDFPALVFHDQQQAIAFKGRHAYGLKRQLRREIKTTQRYLVIISQQTWQSEWVNWEINTAVQQDKKLLATKLDPTNITPIALLEADPLWIDPFNPQELSQCSI